MTLRFGYLRIPVAIFISLIACLAIEPVHAATPSPDIQPEHYLLAQSFLGEKLLVWQKRLNLTSWTIRIELTRSSGLRPKTLGNIHWDLDTHTAEIRVLAPEDYQLSTPDMLADMECTVVHELVHLQLSSLPRSEDSRGAEEHAVIQITQALLNLDRRQHEFRPGDPLLGNNLAQSIP